MKVVSILGSPLIDKGNTAMILNYFLEGLKEGGADVDIFYTRKLNINPCKGCIACWVKTPGKCVQNDDMQMLLPKMIDADVWIFATPLYMDGMTSSLKALIDRLCPMGQPFMEICEGHNYHVLRESLLKGKIVLVSNSGFWELDNFDPLLSFTKALCRNFRREFAGTLLRPHGPSMRFVKNAALQDVFAAARQSGRELAEFGRMSQELADRVAQPLLQRDEYVAMINQGFETILKARGLL